MKTLNSPKLPQLRLLRGYTLIEMLVVIAIIAVLAAIIVPVFVSARDTSRISSCASNLRQINLAINQYVQDNNRFYPSAITDPIDCSWVDRVFGYVKTPSIFECPSLTDGRGDYQPGCPPRTRIGDVEDSNSFLAEHDGSYSINTLRSVATPGNLSGSVSEVRLQHPSDTILVIDGNGHSWVSPGGQKPLDIPELTVEQLNQGGIETRHRGGNNALFVDGHVKWLRIEQMTERNLWLASKMR